MNFHFRVRTIACLLILIACYGVSRNAAFLPSTPWKSYYNFPTGRSSASLFFSDSGDCFASNYRNRLEVFNSSTGFPIWALDREWIMLAEPLPASGGRRALLAIVVGPSRTNGPNAINFNYYIKDFCSGDTVLEKKIGGKSFVNVSNSLAVKDSNTIVLLVSTTRNSNSYEGYGNQTYTLVSIDVSSGVENWNWQSPLVVNGTSWITLTAGHGAVIAVLSENAIHVLKFDSKTGHQDWDCTTGCCTKARASEPPLVASASTLVLQVNRGGDPELYSFCALDLSTKQVIWEHSKSYAGSSQTIAVKGSTVVATSNRPNGGINSNKYSHIFAFALLTGEPIWNVSFMGTLPIQALPQQSTVLLAYWLTVVCYDWDTGRNIWNWTVVNDQYSEQQVMAIGVSKDAKKVAAFTEAGAYDQNSNYVHVGETHPPHFVNGTVTNPWCASVGGNQAGQYFEPAVDETRVFQCGYAKMYALSKENGTKLWSFAGGPIESRKRFKSGYPSSQLYPLMSPFLTGNDTVTVAWLLGLAGTGPLNMEGEVYALNRKTGEIVWQLSNQGGDLDNPVYIQTAAENRYLLVTQMLEYGTKFTVYDTNNHFHVVWSRANITVQQTVGSQLYIQEQATGVITLIDIASPQTVHWKCASIFCTKSQYFVVYPSDPSLFFTLIYDKRQIQYNLTMVSSNTFTAVWNAVALNGFGSISLTEQFASFWAHGSYYVYMRKTGLSARNVGVSYGWNGAVGSVIKGTTLYGGSSRLFALDLVRNVIRWTTGTGIWGSLGQTPSVITNSDGSVSIYAMWDTSFCRYDISG